MALFVMYTVGTCKIVAECDLKKEMHGLLCVCDTPERCDVDGLIESLETLDDDDYWTMDGPNGERFEWEYDTGEGYIRAVRITEPLPLSTNSDTVK